MWDVLKTGTLSKITKTDKKECYLSLFREIQIIKILNEIIFNTHCFLRKRHIIQSFKNNVDETCVYNINEYDIFIKRDNTYKGIAC